MIFQTKDDEKTNGWTDKVTVFGKSLHDIGSSVGNAFQMSREGRDGFWSSLKRNLSSKEEVPELISENQAKWYLNQIQSAEKIPSKKKKRNRNTPRRTFSSEEWNETFRIDPDVNKSEKWLTDYAQSDAVRSTKSIMEANKAAHDAAVEHNKELEKTSPIAKAGQAAMKGLALAGNMIASWAISEVVNLVAGAVDNLVHAQSKAIDAAAEAANEYDAAKSRLAGLNEEYETQGQRIKELAALQANGTITLEQEAELGRLQKQNETLERQISLQESLLEVKQKASAEAARKASGTERSYTEAMQEEYGGFLGTIIGAAGYLDTYTDPATGLSTTAAMEWQSRDTSELGLARTDIDNLKKYQAELENVEKQLASDPGDSGLLERQQKLNEQISETRQSLYESASLFQGWIDQSTDARGAVISGAEASVDEWRGMLNEINNLGKNESEIEWNNLETFFGSSGGGVIEKRLGEIVKKSGNAADALAEFERMGLRLEDIDVSADAFKRYFEEIALAAGETDEALSGFENNLSVGEVTAAFSTANAGDGYKTMAGNLKKADELYRNGEIGTDEFQAVAQWMTAEDLRKNEENYKYDATAYQKAWEQTYAKVSRWFDGENPADGIWNFAEDLAAAAPQLFNAIDRNTNTLDLSGEFKSTAQAAKELGVGVGVVETAMHRLEDYGFEFDGILFSGEEINRYESALEGIRDVYENMSEGREKERLGGLLEGWDTEYESCMADLSNLTEEKRIRIEFEYDLVTMEQEIQALRARARAEGGQNSETNASIIAGNATYIETAKRGLGLDQLPEDAMPSYFAEADGRMEHLYEQLKGMDYGTDEYFEVQARIVNEQEMQKELLDAFSVLHPEINAESNPETVRQQWDEFLLAPRQLTVEGTLDGESLREQMDTLSAGSTITYEADLDGVRREITALKNADGSISYEAEIDDTTFMLAGVEDKNHTITYTVTGEKEVEESVAGIQGSVDNLPDEYSFPINADGSGAFDEVQKFLYYLGQIPSMKTVLLRYSQEDGTNTGGQSPNPKAAFSTNAGSGIPKGTKVVPRAFASGTIPDTSWADPDWQTEKSQEALTGELGRELVVKGNRWWTVGDDGAQFTRIPQGSVVFDADQTRHLLENGRIHTRGRALLSGTAYGDGTAHTGGMAYNHGTAYAGGSAGGAEKVFDWVEKSLSNIGRVIDSIAAKAKSIFSLWGERDMSLAKQIEETRRQISLQQQGYDKYMEKAHSYGLDFETELKVAIGGIDISTVTDEALVEKIEGFEEWMNKARECQEAIEELDETVKELESRRFDNLADEFGEKLETYDHQKNMLDAQISQAEELGLLASEKYYQALADNEAARLDKLRAEQDELVEILDSLVDRGIITPDTSAWHEMRGKIDEVSESILDAEEACLSFNNELRQIGWERFDKVHDSIEALTREADFFVDILSDKKPYDDNGKLTDAGLATMGMHGTNYNIYMEQALNYTRELEAVEREIAENPHDEALQKRKKELLRQRQDMVLAARDERKAIVDMVKDGVELELDALQELIDKYGDTLDAKKNLHDYQKQVAKQGEEVSSLQKQLSAYAGDDSEEAKRTIQELTVSLKAAREDLEETEYEQYVSDQKRLLDDLYSEYEQVMNRRLDGVDLLLDEMIGNLNANASTIHATLEAEAERLGISVSTELGNLWNMESLGEQGIREVLGSYNGSFVTFAGIFSQYKADNYSQMNGVQATLGTIGSGVATLVEAANQRAQADLERLGAQSGQGNGNANQTGNGQGNAGQAGNGNANQGTGQGANGSGGSSLVTTQGTGGDGVPRVGERVTYTAGNYTADSWGNGAWGNRHRNEAVYITNINPGAPRPVHISTGNRLGQGDLGWVEPHSQLWGFAKGCESVPRDMLAVTQEEGAELVVRPQTGEFTVLKKYDSIIPRDMTKNLFAWGAINPGDLAAHGAVPENAAYEALEKAGERAFKRAGAGNVPSSTVVQNFDNVRFEMPNVQNYNELVRQMQADNKFEKLIQSMTIGRMMGGNSLEKFKYRF